MIKYSDYKLDEEKYIPYIDIQYNTKCYDILGILSELRCQGKVDDPIDELCNLLAENFKYELKQTIEKEIEKYDKS